MGDARTSKRTFRGALTLGALSLVLVATGCGSSGNTTKEAATSVAQREPVLYLFRKSGPPWLLTESQGRYGDLGPLVRLTRQENFTTLLRLIRERVPQVPWDERMVNFHSRADTLSSDLGGHQTTSRPPSPAWRH